MRIQHEIEVGRPPEVVFDFLIDTNEPILDDAAHRALLPLGLRAEPLDQVRANGHREPSSILRRVTHAMTLAVAPPTQSTYWSGLTTKSSGSLTPVEWFGQ